MVNSLTGERVSNRLTAYCAAAMYGGAAFLGLAEDFIPGGPNLSLIPGLSALVLSVLLFAVGPRLPHRALALVGPLGVVMIAIALATTPGAGDGAVMYMWPVLWTAYFFGRRETIVVVGCVGVAHAVALYVLPSAYGYADRWVDVMMSVSIVAAVVQVLVVNNRRLLDRIRAEARTDHLTGVLNRRGLHELVRSTLAQARRDGSHVAIAVFDIDFFKKTNDEWGHDVGDRVLAYLAATLVNHSRGIDLIARLGGEEFVVVMPRCTAQSAAGFTERVRRTLATDDDVDLPEVRVSAGVAAAIAPPDISELLQHADHALYSAKRAGRDRTVVFRDDGSAQLRAIAG